MAKLVVLLLVSLSIACTSSNEDETGKEKLGRGSRNYDNVFGDSSYGYKQDDPDRPVYSDAPQPPKIQREDVKPFYPIEEAKKYDQYFPSYPTVYKDYPYYWKGSSQPISPATSIQMMEMMSMMKELQDTKQGNEPGFFSKLISDPKSILVAAIIPVSIMLASFIPLLVNYFMTANSLPTVLSTVAGNKNGRNFNESDYLEAILEEIAKYGDRVMEEDGCIEKAVCLFVEENTANRHSAYIKTAKTVVTAVKPEWFGESRVAKILLGIKQNDCSDVCWRNLPRSKNAKSLNVA